MNFSYINLNNVPVYDAATRLAALETISTRFSKILPDLGINGKLNFQRQADFYVHLLGFLAKYIEAETVLVASLSSLPLNVFKAVLAWFSSNEILSEETQLQFIEQDYQQHLAYAIAKENQDKNPATKVHKTEIRIKLEQMGWEGWAKIHSIKPLALAS